MSDDELKTQVRRARAKFAAMAGTYTLGVFNDNFFKQSACLIAIYTAREEMQNWGVIVFTLPWLLCAAPAGWLADRFPKSRVVVGAKALELAAMTCGAIGIITVSWPLIMVMMFMMALQSTIFSPALNGSIPELYPASYVIKANSTLKMLVTSANLVGIILAGVALKYAEPVWGDVPMGYAVVAVGVVSISAIGLLMSFGVVHRPAAAPRARFPWRGPVDTVADLLRMRKDRLLAVIVAGDAFVWFVAVLQILIVNEMGKKTFSLDTQQTSYMLTPELLGVAVGGVLAGWLAKGEKWYRVLPPAMGLLGVFTLLVTAVAFLPGSMGLPWAASALLAAGIAGGVLLIPMESFFQIRPAPKRKGAVIAAGNFAGFLGMALAAVANLVLQKLMPCPPWRFAVVGVLSLIASLWLWRELAREGRREDERWRRKDD